MNTRGSLLIILVILLGFMTACAPPRPAVELQQPSMNSSLVSPEQRKEKTSSISSWEIRGAMAAKNKSKGWSATMNWVQNGPNSYRIRLMGPLGAGSVLINKEGNTITFQDGPKKISSTNAAELLRQQTGINLPVGNLYYWIRGLPAPGKVEQRTQEKHLTQLKQDGYTVSFDQYTSVKGFELPGLIRLEGNGVMVKVIIKKWII